MSVSKTRLVVLGLAAAGAVAVGFSMGVGHDLRLEAAEPGIDAGPAAGAPDAKPAGRAGGDVRVDAPGTAVNVDKERGKVSVVAPYADVQVDPDKGRVQVHAPYVNLDVRW
jgi:CO/xanthine dehydrogenase Mo-binding subunit